jgi:hypothetical protein
MKMKLTLFACFFSLSISAQPYLNGSEIWTQYHYGNVWVGHDLDYTGTYQYSIQGTEIVNGKSYYRIQRTGIDTITEFGSTYSQQVDFFALHLREEGSQWLVYQDNGNEIVLYDFDLEIGQSIDWAPCVDVEEHIVESISTIQINGEDRRVYTVSGHEFKLIEGVGWANDLELYGCDDFPTQDNFLLCFEKDGINNLIRPGSGEACGVSSIYNTSNPPIPLKVAPNPAQHQLFIQSDPGHPMIRLELWNAVGQRIYSIDFPNAVVDYQLNRGLWPTGTYFLRVIDQRGTSQSSSVFFR